MKLKVLVLLTLFTFALLLIPFEKSQLLSVFRLTDSPVVVTKGNYGLTPIIEVSFSHDGFDQWLENLSAPYPLLMLDAEWIDRSPNSIKIIKEKQIPTGLLGKKLAVYEKSKLLKKELTSYSQAFDRLPLWFTTQDHLISEELRDTLFSQEVNTLAPSIIWNIQSSEPKLKKGMIVAIPIHEESVIDFKRISKFIDSHDFISLEENIFGYQLKTKQSP